MTKKRGAVKTTKMCYGDSMLADTRSMVIILEALLEGEEGVVIDFKQET